MNPSTYLAILIAFAGGYILGVLTSKLLKIAIILLVIAAAVIGFYLFYLR